jgi:hypothetical protein
VRLWVIQHPHLGEELLVAVVGGSLTVATTVVGAAMAVGSQHERMDLGGNGLVATLVGIWLRSPRDLD